MIVEPLTEQQQRAFLTAGATLVLARPYSTSILITQSLALLRDIRGGFSPEASCLRAGELTLSPLSHTVQVRKQPPLRLTPLECQLLHTLMRHQNQTLPVDILLEHLYGCPSKGSQKMVRQVVSRLRAKIEPEPHNPRYVITVRSVGYVFNDS